MCSGSEAGSYLRLIDFCIRRESNKEREGDDHDAFDRARLGGEAKRHLCQARPYDRTSFHYTICE